MLPLWVAPVQVKILPITDNQRDYALKLKEKFLAEGIRVEVDDRNEKTGYKIREAQLQKIPYMLIVGEKEVESNTVSVRSRENGDLGTKDINEFINGLKTEIKEKRR